MSDDAKLTAELTEASGIPLPSVSAATPIPDAKQFPAWTLWTGLMLFLGHLPLLASYGMGLMSREPYQFAPLSVAAAIFLVWHRLRLFSQPLTTGSPRVALGFLVVSFCLLGVATFKWSPWLAVVSALLTALGVVWGLGGFSLVKTWSPAAIMLIILLRPPLGLDTKFTLALRGLAVQLSSCLLDQFGVAHFLSGNVVEVVNQRFLVEEACSGINSVLFIGAFSLFYTFWRRRPWWYVLIVLLATISFVLLGNVLRITVGAMLSYRYEIDVLSGWRHQTIGLVLFTAYLGIAASTDAFLSFFIVKVRSGRRSSSGGHGEAEREHMGALRKFNSQVAQSFGSVVPHLGLAMGVAFSLLALVQTVRAVAGHSRVPTSAASSLRDGAKFNVPDQIGEWKRIDRNQRNVSYLELQAVYSHVWAFQNGRVVAIVALDYPYPGLHDLTVCYFNQGWNVSVGGKAVKANDAAGRRQDYFEVEMSKKPLSYGYLLYGGFAEDGQWAGKDFNDLMRGRFTDQTPVTYQVQILTSTYAPLSLAEKQQMLQLFFDARQLLNRQVLAQLKQKS